MSFSPVATGPRQTVVRVESAFLGDVSHPSSGPSSDSSRSFSDSRVEETAIDIFVETRSQIRTPLLEGEEPGEEAAVPELNPERVTCSRGLVSIVKVISGQVMFYSGLFLFTSGINGQNGQDGVVDYGLVDSGAALAGCGLLLCMNGLCCGPYEE